MKGVITAAIILIANDPANGWIEIANFTDFPWEARISLQQQKDNCVAIQTLLNRSGAFDPVVFECIDIVDEPRQEEIKGELI